MDGRHTPVVASRQDKLQQKTAGPPGDSCVV